MLERLASLLFASGLVFSLGCDDPLAHLEKALDEGKKAAIAEVRAEAKGNARVASGAEDFSDDEAARKAANGVSLGSGHARRVYYQFIDGKGRVAFVERLSDVPATWRDKVGFVEMDSAPPLSPTMAERTRTRRYASTSGTGSGGTQRVAARMPDTVILYSADWCGACKEAKRHLDAMGINYETRDIDIPENLNDLVAKTGQRGIPVLDVGGRVVTGFSPDDYDDLIRQRT